MALTRQSVGADVHLEGAQTSVNLVAVLAGEGLGSKGGAVELLVLAEAGVCGVGLATVIAGVSGFTAATPSTATPVTGRCGV